MHGETRAVLDLYSTSDRYWEFLDESNLKWIQADFLSLHFDQKKAKQPLRDPLANTGWMDDYARLDYANQICSFLGQVENIPPAIHEFIDTVLLTVDRDATSLSSVQCRHRENLRSFLGDTK